MGISLTVSALWTQNHVVTTRDRHAQSDNGDAAEGIAIKAKSESYIARLIHLTSAALRSGQPTGKNEEQNVKRASIIVAPGEWYDPTQTHTSSPIPNSTSRNRT